MDLKNDPISGLPVLPDDGTGQHRLMGLLPISSPMALPQFKSIVTPIAQSDWQEIDLYATFQPPILDQGQKGSCVGHGGATSFTLTWLMMGEAMLRFAPCYLYGNINGGKDQGADIGATIASLQTLGICLEATVPEGMIFRSQFPSTADTEAAKYKLVDAYQTQDPADVATALQMGYAVADSVMVGRKFMTLDADFIVGLDRGPGNHCVSKGGMKLVNGVWCFINQNSWGDAWGNGGRFLTTEAHIQGQSYYTAVVYRSVTPGPNAPSNLVA